MGGNSAVKANDNWFRALEFHGPLICSVKQRHQMWLSSQGQTPSKVQLDEKRERNYLSEEEVKGPW